MTYGYISKISFFLDLHVLYTLCAALYGEVDICTMAAYVAALTAKLDALTDRMESMDCSNLVNLTKRLDAFEAKLTLGTT